MSPIARVNLFDGPTITDGYGRELVLSDRRRAILAALVISAEPVSRRDLVDAVGIGRSTLRPLLSRLATDDLGLEVPVHRQVEVRRGLIEIDRSLVTSDVDILRRLLNGRQDEATLRAMIELGALNPTPDLGLVVGHPLTVALSGELQTLQRRAAQAVAWFELAGGGSNGSLLPMISTPDPTCLELWLARLDRQAGQKGAHSARSELALVIDQLDDVGFGNDIAAEALASLMIETSDVRPSEVEPRPSAEDRRRAAGILDGLNSDGARVLLVHDRAVGTGSIAALCRPLRSQYPAMVGAWAPPDASAVATLAQLIRPIVAAKIRRPGCDLSARLVTTLVAIADEQRLEPDSTARWFTRDVAAVMRSWSGDDSPLVVVGRPSARSADLDRLLSDLLSLDPELRLVVVHSEAVDGAPAVPSPLDGFSTSVLVMPPPFGVAGPDPKAAQPHGQRRQPLEQRELVRMAGVVALAADEGGLVHRPLAVHLLDTIGSRVDPLQVLDDIEDVHLGVDDTGDDAVPGGQPGPSIPPGELKWLCGEALRWLIAGRLNGGSDISVLRRLVERLGPRHSPAGLCTELLSLAAVAVSHGDLDRGIAVLDIAVATAVTASARAEALALRADCHRDTGDWAAALIDYRSAVALLMSDDSDQTRVADLALRMARLTWDPSVGDEVDRLLRAAAARLDPEDVIWRARLELCIAGGSFQDGSADGSAEAGGPDGGRILRALDAVQTSFDPDARVWGLIHARKAMLGVASAAQSARWAQQIVNHGVLDIAPLAHGHQALFVDTVRQGDWPGARRAMHRLKQLAQTPVSAEQQFSSLVVQTCWDLVSGRLDSAAEGLKSAQDFGSQLGGSTFNQVTLGQTVWLARAGGDQQELEELATAAAGLADSEPGGGIWMAGASLLAVDVGRHAQAADRVVEFARRSGGFDAIRQGAHRLPILGIAAIVAASAAAFCSSSPFTEQDVAEIEAGLAGTDCGVVLIGWPTVILGPVDDFRSLALAVLGRRSEASDAFFGARRIDGGLPALQEQSGGFARLVERLGVSL